MSGEESSVAPSVLQDNTLRSSLSLSGYESVCGVLFATSLGILGGEARNLPRTQCRRLARVLGVEVRAMPPVTRCGSQMRPRHCLASLWI